jgi:hypothetical protein
MTHGSQVVNFVRFRFGNDGDEIGCVTKVAIVQEDFDASLMSVFVNVFNASSIERRGTTDNSMDLMEAEMT